MQATRALREKAAQLLAADTATLAQAADPNHLVLIAANFLPSENLVAGDLVPATFDGATPLEVELGVQLEGLDPATSDAIITIGPPAGGWRWETTGITNLPQTIYGYALMNEAETTLFGAATLTTPVVLTGINQVINLPAVTFRQLAGSLT